METCEKCGGYISEQSDYDINTHNGVGGSPSCRCENKPTKECKGYSMTVSEWKNYGEKYGFDKFFEKKAYDKGFKAGQEGYLKENPLKEIVKNIKEEGKEQTIKQIGEWCDKYMEETTKIYGTDKHGIDPEDLKKFINTL